MTQTFIEWCFSWFSSLLRKRSPETPHTQRFVCWALCRSAGASQSRTPSSRNRTQWRAAFCRSTFWSWPPCWKCRAYFWMIHWRHIDLSAQDKRANVCIQTQLPEPSLSFSFFFKTGNQITDSAPTSSRPAFNCDSCKQMLVQHHVHIDKSKSLLRFKSAIFGFHCLGL